MEMTREELIVENNKLQHVIDRFYKEKNDYQCQIREKEAHIERLKEELKEVQLQNKSELSLDPMDVAKALIQYKKGTGRRLNGEEIKATAFDFTNLRQIAAYLLAYCAVNEDREQKR